MSIGFIVFLLFFYEQSIDFDSIFVIMDDVNVFWDNVEQQLHLRGANWSWLRCHIGNRAPSSMSNMRKTWPRLDDAINISNALNVSLEILCYSPNEHGPSLDQIHKMAIALGELPPEDMDYIRVVIETLRWKARKAAREEAV
jgi:hypothetical protein